MLVEELAYHVESSNRVMLMIEPSSSQRSGNSCVCGCGKQSICSENGCFRG